MFGIDATTYPRPNAECSPDRGLHYAPCRCDGDRKVVPGWQFQWVMGLEWGTSSQTLPAGARHLPEGTCPVTATAGQTRELAGWLGRQQEPAGRPAPLFILDQGYAAAALTHALDGLEVQLLVRMAGDRVFYDGRPGPRRPGSGRNGVHGQRFELAAGADLRCPDQLLVVPDTSRYGRVEVRAWHGMHQKVQRTGYFARLEAELFTGLPVIEGTIIEVRAGRLPDGRSPHRTMWLWHSGPHAPDLDVCWRACLRRFDMENSQAAVVAGGRLTDRIGIGVLTRLVAPGSRGRDTGGNVPPGEAVPSSARSCRRVFRDGVRHEAHAITK
jgi:hypothetical protein